MGPKPQLTHFLCVPLANETSRGQLARSFDHFRARLSEASAGQLDPDKLGTAIRPTSTIHLTLGVMSLTSEERINDACSLLRNLDIKTTLESSKRAVRAALPNQGTSTQSLHVSLTSLSNFRRGSKTSVLYAEPLDTTARLLPFCNNIRQRFIDAGYIVDDGRGLTLHATVLNTLYARDGSRGQRGRTRPLQFDPAGLIEEFQDFIWMEEIKLDRLAICKMGAEKVVDGSGAVIDERYTEVARVRLP